MRKLEELALKGKTMVEMKVEEVICRAAIAINNEKGADDWTNMLVKIVIGLVIGIVVLGGLYLTIGDVVLPMVQEKIVELFDFTI